MIHLVIQKGRQGSQIFEYHLSLICTSTYGCCHDVSTWVNINISLGAFGRVSYVPKYAGGYFVRKCPTNPFDKVQYGLDTLPNTPAVLGTNSIPVPDTSVRSVRPEYRTRLFSKFGTTSIPVPDTSVRALHRIPGVFTLPKWFGTASIPYRTLWYVSVRARYRCPTLG